MTRADCLLELLPYPCCRRVPIHAVHYKDNPVVLIKKWRLQHTSRNSRVDILMACVKGRRTCQTALGTCGSICCREEGGLGLRHGLSRTGQVEACWQHRPEARTACRKGANLGLPTTKPLPKPPPQGPLCLSNTQAYPCANGFYMKHLQPKLP
jgi:hypothetical protein